MAEFVHISQIVQELDRHNLLPAIVFRSSRNQCDIDAERSAGNPKLRLSPVLQRELRARIHEIIKSYEIDPELIVSHQQYNSLILTGIGAHHAGQLLVWRLLLEELMAAGLLRILVATGTVAAGVDFPARTVVITAHSKRGADGFRPLTSAEFQQMSGRAGRRGRDTVGFCVVAPSPFCDARVLLHVSKQPPEPLVSAYFPSPSTVLNLLRYRNVDDLRYTVERSLASFIDRKNSRALREQALEEVIKLPENIRLKLLGLLENQNPGDGDELTKLEGFDFGSQSKEEKKILKRIRRYFREANTLESRQRKLLDTAFSGLQELGYLDGVNLSEKGYWAANLCTNLVIELGEIIESGILDNVNAEVLVSIVASISGDPHRQYLTAKKLIFSKEQSAQIASILARVKSTGMPGGVELVNPIPAAANTAYVWLHSNDWHEFRSVLALAGVAEGDAARLITQTAEHLNQLTRLSETHQKLALIAEEAKRRLLRPPLTEVINIETI